MKSKSIIIFGSIIFSLMIFAVLYILICYSSALQKAVYIIILPIGIYLLYLGIMNRKESNFIKKYKWAILSVLFAVNVMDMATTYWFMNIYGIDVEVNLFLHGLVSIFRLNILLLSIMVFLSTAFMYYIIRIPKQDYLKKCIWLIFITLKLIVTSINLYIIYH